MELNFTGKADFGDDTTLSSYFICEVLSQHMGG